MFINGENYKKPIEQKPIEIAQVYIKKPKQNYYSQLKQALPNQSDANIGKKFFDWLAKASGLDKFPDLLRKFPALQNTLGLNKFLDLLQKFPDLINIISDENGFVHVTHSFEKIWEINQLILNSKALLKILEKLNIEISLAQLLDGNINLKIGDGDLKIGDGDLKIGDGDLNIKLDWENNGSVHTRISNKVLRHLIFNNFLDIVLNDPGLLKQILDNFKLQNEAFDKNKHSPKIIKNEEENQKIISLEGSLAKYLFQIVFGHKIVSKNSFQDTPKFIELLRLNLLKSKIREANIPLLDIIKGEASIQKNGYNVQIKIDNLDGSITNTTDLATICRLFPHLVPILIALIRAVKFGVS